LQFAASGLLPQTVESLRRDCQNAVYLESYGRNLPACLQPEENHLAGLKITSNAANARRSARDGDLSLRNQTGDIGNASGGDT